MLIVLGGIAAAVAIRGSTSPQGNRWSAGTPDTNVPATNSARHVLPPNPLDLDVEAISGEWKRMEIPGIRKESVFPASLSLELAPPQHGTALWQGSGIAYRSVDGYKGQDEFQYTIRDKDKGVTSGGKVRVKVLPAPAGAAVSNAPTAKTDKGVTSGDKVRVKVLPAPAGAAVSNAPTAKTGTH